jgi:hypothetical protein
VVDAREYLLLAALTGHVARGENAKALELWKAYGAGSRASRPTFRLLRCHAERASCADAFRDYAVR